MIKKTTKSRINKLLLSPASKSILQKLYAAYADAASPMTLCDARNPALPPALPPFVKTWMTDNHPITTTSSFHCKIGTTIIDMDFILWKHERNSTVLQWAERVGKWLQLALTTQPHNPDCPLPQHMHIVFYMTPLKKYMPVHAEDIVDEENINTAFTYSCSTKNQIVIYRKEDWFKTFLHETFHAFGFDFSHVNEPQLSTANRQILNLFRGCDPHLDVRLYETYCETWAQMMNLLILFRGSLFAFMRAFIRDRKFVHDQLTDYLRVYGLTYRQLMEPSTTPKYTEKTNVFAYFVLRIGLLYRIDEFILWSNRNNIPPPSSSSSTISLVFNKTKIMSFVDLVHRACLSVKDRPVQPPTRRRHRPSFRMTSYSF
jgi:hypothetical protein